MSYFISYKIQQNDIRVFSSLLLTSCRNLFYLDFYSYLWLAYQQIHIHMIISQKKYVELIHGHFVVQVNLYIHLIKVDFYYLVNTQCGTYTNRLCYTESKGLTIAGIIVFAIVSLFIFIMILHACIKCCLPRTRYHSLSPTDPAYLSRSGVVVCTVPTSHC